jgi:hypothetical protein
MDNQYIEDCVPCNDLTFFELSAARTWAMYVLNSHANVKLVLDVTGANKTSRWFLANDIPQTSGGITLVPWRAVQNEHTIEYTNSENDHVTTWHIRSFTSSRFPSLYVSLYDIITGARFAPLCLIIWERNHPDVSNQGYADGRCPEFVKNNK